MSLFVVPMDLDVKMKAVMLGACFLIVSAPLFIDVFLRRLFDNNTEIIITHLSVLIHV